MIAKQNLLKALDYLLHLDKLGTSPVLTLKEHRLPVFHEQDVEGLPGVETNLIEGATEVWLEVRRLRSQPPPQPEATLTHWINLRDDPDRPPSLKPTIELGRDQLPPALRERLPYATEKKGAEAGLPASDSLGGHTTESVIVPDRLELHLEDFPEITEQFNLYQQRQWQPWAVPEAPRRKSIKLYDQLFSLLQDAEVGGAEDAVEVAWGVGLARWAHQVSGKRIDYPLITRTVEIHLDEHSMALQVTPTERQPDIHVDCFKVLGIENADQVIMRARKELDQAEKTFCPLDAESFQGILRFAAAHLDEHGVYWPDEAENALDRSMPAFSNYLVITDHWVIFARKRSKSFVAADVERIKQAVQDAEELPAAAALIVTEPPDENRERIRLRYRGLSALGGIGDSEGVVTEDETDLYFPKPFNAEQVRIIEQLDHAPGVVVQGPPGTGKTHTIANIICHYLALGKRVLVTAQHEAPLAVLQEQIPEGLRPLTISLLTSEREGLRQLEQAVRKIADEVRRLDPHQLAQDIASDTTRIDHLHQRLAVLDEDLRALAAQQTTETPFFGKSWQPADLARHVVVNEKIHAWFPDRLAGDGSTKPRFSDEDIDDLRAARRRLGTDLVYFGRRIPDAVRLPLPDDMATMHQALVRFGELQHEIDAKAQIPPLRDYSVQALEALEALRAQVIEVHECLRIADQEAWAFTARPLLADQASTVGRHIKQWVVEALDVEKARQALLGDAVDVSPQALTNPALHLAVRNAVSGKRPFPLFGADQAAKALFGQIRRHGLPPATPADWKPVLHHLDIARRAIRLVTTWEQLRHEIEGPPGDGSGIGEVRTLHRFAQALRALWWADQKLVGPLRVSVDRVFADGAQFADATSGLASLECLLTAVDLHLEHSRLRSVLNSAAAVNDELDGCGGPVVDDARSFLDQLLGSNQTTVEEIRQRWQVIVKELRRIAALQGDLTRVDTVSAHIEKSGASRWAKALRTEAPQDDQDLLLPPDWRSAWEWARAQGYLDAIGGRERLQHLSEERLSAEADLRAAYARVVELRTWKALNANMTPAISAALAAYLAAVTRIGAGMGVRATRHRRDARKAMSNAYGATPCWIMAHWRVSEALPPRLGMFDLVVIDEASQSDIRAFPAILRAKKLLVVGDDKQVSPSDVGIKESEIADLRARFLGAFPYGQHFLPGSSIYELGSTMFARDVIRLREHFRCVEPIIAFSNRHFYGGEIRPLRIPKPSERLDPPLIDVYVRGGYRQGKRKINLPEANAIVAEVERLTADPTIGQRTIGVVSLLGAEQAKAIQDQLLERLGEECFLRHRIRCGDAMHFQGKEADIVLISMVAAGQITAATSRAFEQRYNVACSRARDRLYVFRSFPRDQLKDGDLRAKLLDHLARPLGDTQAIAHDLRSLCESDFEREVFDALVLRGYRVLPQVRAGGFRIDLVVEGLDDRRLAIECDGDRYHGVDRWMADMDRQRILERMGWRFWRCWASSWFAEQDACLGDLIDTLEADGITPWSTDSGAATVSLVEHRIIEPESDEEPVADESDEPEAAETDQAATVPARESAEPTLDEPEATSRAEVTTAGNGQIDERCVELNDIVEYAHENRLDERLSVTVVSGESQPNYGIVNRNTPLGSALLGAMPGEIVEAHLPQGIDRIKIIDIRRTIRG